MTDFELQLRFRPALPDDWALMDDAIGARPVMVTAAQVARSRTALPARLMLRPGYRIDPITHRLDPRLGWTIGAHGTKVNYSRLDAEYSAGLGVSLLGRPPRWATCPAAIRAEYAANVLRFQHGYLLREQKERLRLFRPSMLLDVDTGLRPGGLLAPYVPIGSGADADDQLALWADCPPELEDIPVELVLVLLPSVLDDPRLVTRVLEASERLHQQTVWVWFVGELRRGLDETIAARLRAERTVVKGLAGSKVVKMLHCGFFELALSYDGAHEAAFGLNMSSPGLRGGGGVALGLFYSSVLHRNLWYSEARQILGACRSLADLASQLCPCEMCAEAANVSSAHFSSLMLSGLPLTRNGAVVPGRERATTESAQLNRFHNLIARDCEARLISRLERRALVMSLTTAALPLARSDGRTLARLAHELL